MGLLRYVRLTWAFAEAYWNVWIRFPRLTQVQRLTAIQAWARHVLTLLGVELAADHRWATNGGPQEPMLWVSNHVSWLDILVIQAIHPCVFVAKSEVRSWPILGRLADSCGVIFVDRGSASGARLMVDQVVQSLSQGLCVAGFPEGTTTDGEGVGVFHANLFEAAIRHGVPVQPLALRYVDPCTGLWCPQVVFIGDTSLMTSLHQIVKTSRIQARVRWGAQLSGAGHSRRSLAHVSRESISAQLGDTVMFPSKRFHSALNLNVTKQSH